MAAAHTMGAKPRRILLVHLLPQVWGPLLVYATSIIANNIIFEASLSYLGVGVPPPTPSWGQMLSDAVTSGMYQVDLSLALVPGLALVLTMLSFNLLGDGLHDALDPRGDTAMRRRILRSAGRRRHPGVHRDAVRLAALLRHRPLHRSLPGAAHCRQDGDNGADRPGGQAARA